MAKEQVHFWLRTAVLLAAIVFAGGGYAMKINGNTGAIAEVRSDSKKADEKLTFKVERNEQNVHQLEVNQERDIALKESLLSTMTRLEGKMDVFGTEQNQIKIDVNTTKVKVNTLIKD